MLRIRKVRSFEQGDESPLARPDPSGPEPSRRRALVLAALAAVIAPACVVEFPPAREGDAGLDDGGSDVGPDSGPPKAPCSFDQDAPAGPGCPLGQVCNLKTLECQPGFECASNQDCLACSSAGRVPGEDLGDVCNHGFAVTSWCDFDHHPEPESGLGICTRTRSPCERCVDDEDCGYLNDGLAIPAVFGEGPLAVRCIDYGGGAEDRFCSRPCNPFDSNDPLISCPRGFKCEGLTVTSGRCIQGRETCERTPVFCPAPRGEPDSVEQIGSSQPCPGGGLCETNDRPGATGLCSGACRSDADCPDPDLPVCNLGNGLCVPDCRDDVVACEDLPEQPQVCHPLIGLCALSCDRYDEDGDGYGADELEEADAFCQRTYGASNGEVYCNLFGRGGPDDGKFYKNYYREGACVRLGCEIDPIFGSKPDCGFDAFCDQGADGFPTCRSGCRSDQDCTDGLWCRVGLEGVPDDPSEYSPEECEALPPFVAPDDDPSAHGVCCRISEP